MSKRYSPKRLARVVRIQSRALGNLVAARRSEHERVTDYLGYRFVFPSRSQIGRAVAQGLVWDEPLRGIVNSLMPGAFVCDVGANLGASLLTMCHERSDLRFVCFEASPRYIEYLRRNVSCNNLYDRVEIHQSLIGPDGAGWTLSSDVTTGSVVQLNPFRRHLLTEDELESVSLDTWFAARQLPALMKIDTDGFDLKVLMSGTRLLARGRPHLFVEFSPSLLTEVGDSAADLLSFLVYVGYRTADLYAPTGELLDRDVPLPDVTTGRYNYIDLSVHGKAL